MISTYSADVRCRNYFFFLTTTTATTATTTTTITIGTTGEDFLEDVVEASLVVLASLDALEASSAGATASGLSELKPDTVNVIWIESVGTTVMSGLSAYSPFPSDKSS